MPALVEDIPEPAAGWQGQAGNLLSRYFISSPWGLRGAGTGTKEQNQRQEGAQAPLTASRSLSLPWAFHDDPCQRPAVTDSTQDESLTNYPTEDNGVTASSSTRLNKRARPRDLVRLEEQKEALGLSEAFPHLQAASLHGEQPE